METVNIRFNCITTILRCLIFIVEWHWHVEFEFVFVQEGTATFWVGEKQFSLGQGTGIFINSKILHRYFSEGHAIVPNFVLKPTFLAPADSLIYKKYIAPIQACKVDCIVFCREINGRQKH